jgi:hypothetical protein
MKNSKQFKRLYASLLILLILMLTIALEVYAYERISSRENSVRVDVTPVQLTFGQQAKFEIRMNTHSVDLSQNMVAVSTLKDSNGREYLPKSWDGSPPGGHHRSGVLEFPAIEGEPDSVTLIVREISNVPERTFTWKINR